MNRLQSNLYKLLEEIDDICRQGGVQYYLAGGTALGTVRNHCFLPWDDDIDLYITRDNWNRLRSFIENNDVLPEGRAFIYKENTPYYCNPIPRYVDLTTTSMMKSQVLPAKSLGQHIELLIMDPMPADDSEIEDHINLLKAYTEIVSPYFVVNKNLSIEDFEKHFKIYNKFYWKCKFFGFDKIIKEMEETLLQYSEEDCKEFCMRWGIDILRYKHSDYGKSRLEMFEGKEFPVAEHAEGIFRIAYGDSWMYIPNVDNQITHNTLKDFDEPFKTYTDLYLPIIDRKKYFKAYKRNKRSRMKQFAYKLRIDMLAAKAKAIIAEKEMEKNFNVDSAKLRELLVNKNYAELNRIFSVYYKTQLNGELRRYNLFINIDDDILYYAMINYIEQGEYYNANKLLKLRKSAGELTEKIKDIESKISLCRTLSVEIYDNDNLEAVENILNCLSEECRDLIDVHRAYMWILKKKEQWEELERYSSEIFEIYNFDGETLAYKALANYKLGNKETSKALYEKAVLKTRNGFVWDDAKQLVGIEQIKYA